MRIITKLNFGAKMYNISIDKPAEVEYYDINTNKFGTDVVNLDSLDNYIGVVGNRLHKITLNDWKLMNILEYRGAFNYVNQFGKIDAGDKYFTSIPFAYDTGLPLLYNQCFGNIIDYIIYWFRMGKYYELNGNMLCIYNSDRILKFRISNLALFTKLLVMEED